MEEAADSVVATCGGSVFLMTAIGETIPGVPRPLDEFQERSESDWENRTLVNILDHRHADILPTMIVANLFASAFVTAPGPSLTGRIRQTGGVMECGWGSMRG